MENDEIMLDGDLYQYIPDGEYEAVCTGFNGPVPYRGTRKLYLNFEITSEHYQGATLFMVFNIPWAGIRPGSRYFKYWSKVNGGLPSRNTKFHPRIFKDKIYRITTATVKPTFDDNSEMPFGYWYSKVQHFEVFDEEKRDNKISKTVD